MVNGHVWDVIVACLPLVGLIRPLYRLRCPQKRSELRTRLVTTVRQKRLVGTIWLICRQGSSILFGLLNLATLLGVCAISTKFSNSDPNVVTRQIAFSLIGLTWGAGAASFIRKHDVEEDEEEMETKKEDGPDETESGLRLGWVLSILSSSYQTIKDWHDGPYGKISAIANLLQMMCSAAAVFGLSLPRSWARCGALLTRPRESPRLPRPPSPEGKASVFQLAILQWLTPLIELANKRSLEAADLYDLVEEEAPEILYEQWDKVWHERPQWKSQWLLPLCLFRFRYVDLLIATFYKLLSDTLSLMTPVFLSLIVTYVSARAINDPECPSLFVGLTYVAMMIAASLSAALTMNQHQIRQWRLQLSIRSALSSAIYGKALLVNKDRIDLPRRPDRESESAATSTGQIVNLISIDAERMPDLIQSVYVFCSTPYQIALAAYLLYAQIKTGAFVAMATMFLAIPLSNTVRFRLRRAQRVQMRIRDERMTATHEMLMGIKAVKIYAWEPEFARRINGVRGRELAQKWKLQLLQLVLKVQWTLVPVLTTIAGFGYYSLVLKQPLDAATIFTTLSIFNILRRPLNSLPNTFNQVLDSMVTANRLQLFLELPEVPPFHHIPILPGADVVEVERLRVQYPGSAPVLDNVNLNVTPREHLVGIVGKTGSGKSSLLSAITGEIQPVFGNAYVHGSIAYCTQVPWVRSVTLRDNILFGMPFDAQRYQAVLEACALEADLNVLVDGDLTEIGERGINLSGGQKQRVSLARAVYRDADVYLLDDILSAVDAHVAEHIFNRVFQGLLRDKHIIFVTHRFETLQHADQIIFLHDSKAERFTCLDKALQNPAFEALAAETVKVRRPCARALQPLGSLTSSVMSSEVLLESTADVTQLTDETALGTDELLLCVDEPRFVEKLCAAPVNGQVDEGTDSPGKSVDQRRSPARLIGTERVETGAVPLSVYKAYITRAGGFFLVLSLLGACVGTQLVQVGSTVWLSYWSNHAKPSLDDPAYISSVRGITTYSCVALCAVVTTSIAALLLALATQTAARKFHEDMLKQIMRAPMSFFESTPVGRILNRFSKDLFVIDNPIPDNLYNYLNQICTVACSMGVVVVAIPYSVVVLAPLGLVYSAIQRKFIEAARQLKRIQSTLRSPVFSHFTETLDGLPTIRAYQKMRWFAEMEFNNLQAAMGANFLNMMTNRWLSVRLELTGSLVVGCATFCSVVGAGAISGGLAGLAISYAMSVTSDLNEFVRVSGVRESNIVSVERVLEYSEEETVPQEAYEPIVKYNLPPDWPTQGKICIRNLNLKYRADLPMVLKNINFDLAPGEKVGIVGRTGAGKSSLVVAFLRLVEPVSGDIYVDEISLSQLDVRTVRSRLGVIPQDPVLFTGTVRENLDPFNNSTDDQVWAAVRGACLEDVVKALPLGLSTVMKEEGSNFSIGQRQLFCLARVLLKQCRVLLLDEATSAVDPQTDAAIQKTIRTCFKDCTIFTIAHRITTVLDYDKIAVMDQGEVVEFGPPQELLKDGQSFFASLAKAGKEHSSESALTTADGI